ncbi:uncharacterized protein NEMAJ01_2276 [Nematocida major]|uniref:uncharacterized protein n=1 Tax=Nematocida major TaxID=1912982 RepID=UPI0020079188|nr:uncharacterized protein NEMAJ01_2276 [Nematocida major]KAH9387380.1 hypothetical protein NEMAJ01_2276 [Nematocida major]
MPKAHIRLQVGLIWALLSALRHARCVYFTNEDAMGCMRAAVGRVGGEDVYVSPEWAGHPVCVVKIEWLRYVYNMRAYSCGLATSFSLVPRKENGEEVYTYTREPEKDRARLPDSIASAAAFAGDGEYSVAFHRALVHMFGLQRAGWSTYDRLTVETGRPCSFTEFLRESGRTQKEAHYVLAALVLLSEGVDAPIWTSGNRVIVKKRKDGEDVLVDAHIIVPAVESGERQPSETWHVINFFKRHRGTHMLPSTYEEFKTGDFLESPQLLILTYIGEYVKSAEELMSVMECAFKLVEGMGLAESLKDPGSVVSRMFVCAEQLSKAEAYLGPFLAAQEKMEKARVFGEFVHVQKHLNSSDYCEQLTDESDWGEPNREDPPRPEICPEYSGLKEADNSDDSDMLQSTINGPANLESCAKFEDPAGAMCLLLLCLAYDPEKMEYNLQGLLEHIKQTAESAEVRAAILALQAHIEECSFFGAFNSLDWVGRYNDYGPDIFVRLMDIWKTEDLRILDLMCEFATKTGQPKAVVDGLEALLGDSAGVYGDILNAEVLQRINSVVRSLAVRSQAQIETVGYPFGGYNRYAVRVKHPHRDKRRRQAFELVTCQWYVKSSMRMPDPFLSSDVLKEMRSLAAQYRQDAAFPSFVFAECIDRMVLRCNQCRDHGLGKKKIWRAARKTAKRSAERPNRVLLVLPIVGEELREELSAKMLLFAHRYGVALSALHPMAHLVANVIGSTELENEFVREGVFKVPLFVGAMKTLCPSVCPPKGCAAAFFMFYGSHVYRDVYAPKKCMFFTGRINMEHIRTCAAHAEEPLLNCALLKGYRRREHVACFLVAEKPMEILEETITLVLAEHAGKALAEANARVRELLFIWLFAALSSSKAAVHCELIVWVCQELGQEGFYRGCKKEVSDFDFEAVSKALAFLEDPCIQKALESIGWAKLDMLKRALRERRELCLRFRM